MKRSSLRPGTRPLRRKVPVARQNPRRLARLETLQFGPHAELVRRLPCAVCRDDFYARYDDDTLSALMEIARDRGLPRVSDAHHTTTRGAGGTARHLVPLCRAHHRQVTSLGVTTFEVAHNRHRADLPALAARLWSVGSALPESDQ